MTPTSTGSDEARPSRTACPSASQPSGPVSVDQASRRSARFDQVDDRQAVRAGGLGGVEVGVDELARDGRAGPGRARGPARACRRPRSSGVAEDGRDRDAPGGGLAEVAAAVAVEVGGRPCGALRGGGPPWAVSGVAAGGDVLAEVAEGWSSR